MVAKFNIDQLMERMYAILDNTRMKKLVSTLRYACFCGLLLTPWGVFAQGWQRYYDGERLFSIEVLSDGSLVAAGSIRNADEVSDGYWLHADAWGNIITDTRMGNSPTGENAQALLPAPGGNWIVPGNSDGDSILLAKVTAQGNLTTVNYYVTSGLLYSAIGSPSQNGWFFCGAQKGSGVPGNNLQRTLSGRVSNSGVLMWERADSIGLNSLAVDAASTSSGDYWIVGQLASMLPAVNYDVFLLKMAENGALIKTAVFELTDDQTPEKIAIKPGGHLLIAGSVKNPANGNLQEEDIWLAETDTSGNLRWSKAISWPGFQQTHALKQLPNGDLLLAGETRPTLTGSRDAFLARLDGDGNLLWFKTYGGVKGDIFWDVAVLSDGSFAASGQTGSFGNLVLHAWLVHTDSAGNMWSNRIEGQVAHDQAADCLVGAGDAPLVNWLVTAAGVPGRFYTTTDSSGHYEFMLDTGRWYVSVLPSVGYWLPCMDSISVDLVLPADTAVVSFPVQAAYNCPLLLVDITTPYLRRCFDNTYTVRWFNYGPQAATETRIAVLPDPFLTLTGSSVLYTVSGDTLWFNVGPTPSMQGGNLTFTALLDCAATVLGQTHCTTAWISPDSVCYHINPVWDGASLDINGYCAGDSVVLTISNTGSGNMQQAVEYVITEDQVIFKRAPLLLAAGADTTIVLYPNGATVTLMITQTPGHPGNSHPVLVVEGCGNFPFSTGYALQFPTDDGDPFIDTECRENIGSFDPNDKTGLPKGVGEAHLIKAGDAIEYLIRFQNTGTDTAFRVEIRDTLPATLDLVSLELGSSSHSYQVDIKEKGILRFVFSPIALPDSAVNPTASQGFVKYRIDTKKDLPFGTVVQNRAAIYFDFNSAVLTEKTRHIIGDPLNEWTTINTSETDLKPLSKVSASPNPFSENTLLLWPQTTMNTTCNIQITSADGQISAHYTTLENSFLLSDTTLPPGMYFLKIFTDTGVIVAGKIIKTK
jgi:uncharacterized repeat protein (TIGR01451 family)